jgi:hypothetical protein
MAGAPFECPFDRLTVLSDVEGLTALREIEGVARPTEKKRKAGAVARPTEEKKAGINPAPTYYERNRQRETLQGMGKAKSPSFPLYERGKGR